MTDASFPLKPWVDCSWSYLHFGNLIHNFAAVTITARVKTWNETTILVERWKYLYFVLQLEAISTYSLRSWDSLRIPIEVQIGGLLNLSTDRSLINHEFGLGGQTFNLPWAVLKSCRPLACSFRYTATIAHGSFCQAPNSSLRHPKL